jgi:hypothetical protein
MGALSGREMDDKEKMLICAYLEEEVRALAMLATDLKLSKADILANEPAWKIPLDLAKDYDDAAQSLQPERKTAIQR